MGNETSAVNYFNKCLEKTRPYVSELVKKAKIEWFKLTRLKEYKKNAINRVMEISSSDEKRINYDQAKRIVNYTLSPYYRTPPERVKFVLDQLKDDSDLSQKDKEEIAEKVSFLDYTPFQ